MAKSSPLIERYARMGAEARLAELKAEIAEIERTFPGIGAPARHLPGRSHSDAAPAAKTPVKVPRRKRKPMTAAQKKAVGERMRKYWAARRKAKSTAAK
jgi:hypothetical protein